MFGQYELKTALWIYDIDNFCFYWANDAALLWWESKNLAELQARSIEQEPSQAVKQTLRGYQASFCKAHSFTELWYFSPKGIEKKAYCHFSGLTLPDGRMAMLVEANTAMGDMQHSLDAAIAVASFDMNGVFQSCNPPFETEFGNTQPAMLALLTDPSVLPILQKNLHQDKNYELDLLLNNQNGRSWYRALWFASKDTYGHKTILCHLHNIDSRKKRELSLIEQASTDALTGLLNRRGFSETVQPLLDAQQKMLVFYIDLDGFKMINDSLGHTVGDLVLVQVAKRLHECELTSAVYCRFGGDEFVIVLPDPQNIIGVKQVSNMLINKLSAPYEGDSNDLLAISVSIGVAKSPNDSTNLIELIRFADSAMYCSKKQGKKRFTIFSSGMEKEILRKSIITQQLTSAIGNNELSLHYQPIINTVTNSVYCYEALLRWENSQLGHVSPQELIEVAEQVGLISEIENWVMSTALSHLATLRKHAKCNVKIAVNVSSMHLINTDLVPLLTSLTAANNLHPSDVIIEVTESVLFDGLHTQNNPLDAILALGTQISIDDFGTGYSSLAYLYKIKAASTKIDKAFVNMQENSVETLAAIHKVIDSFAMVSIIEGIETEAQAQLAQQAGITLHQGYWYSYPKPIEDYR